MKKIVKFDGVTTYMLTDSSIATPDMIRTRWPAVDAFPHVFEVEGNIIRAVMELAALREFYSLAPELSEEEAIAQLGAIINAPPPPPEPDANERIAAALEFQNLMSLEDAI